MYTNVPLMIRSQPIQFTHEQSRILHRAPGKLELCTSRHNPPHDMLYICTVALLLPEIYALKALQV